MLKLSVFFDIHLKEKKKINHKNDTASEVFSLKAKIHRTHKKTGNIQAEGQFRETTLFKMFQMTYLNSLDCFSLMYLNRLCKFSATLKQRAEFTKKTSQPS